MTERISNNDNEPEFVVLKQKSEEDKHSGKLNILGFDISQNQPNGLLAT